MLTERVDPHEKILSVAKQLSHRYVIIGPAALHLMSHRFVGLHDVDILVDPNEDVPGRLVASDDQVRVYDYNGVPVMAYNAQCIGPRCRSAEGLVTKVGNLATYTPEAFASWWMYKSTREGVLKYISMAELVGIDITLRPDVEKAKKLADYLGVTDELNVTESDVKIAGDVARHIIGISPADAVNILHKYFL
ncbi:MAG: hypothetical protein JZD41_02395 [Thermoproteus sp.]|nr:hypothetical protein [Thermoproteus sp.]